MNNRFLIILFITSLFIGCNKDKTSDVQSKDYLRGEATYKQTCASCHNRDPRKIGALAPDIAGSDLEVIRSMIMTGKPPKGIKPKWPEMEMSPLPHLKDEVPFIYEYLKAFK